MSDKQHYLQKPSKEEAAVIDALLGAREEHVQRVGLHRLLPPLSMQAFLKTLTGRWHDLFSERTTPYTGVEVSLLDAHKKRPKPAERLALVELNAACLRLAKAAHVTVLRKQASEDGEDCDEEGGSHLSLIAK